MLPSVPTVASRSSAMAAPYIIYYDNSNKRCLVSWMSESPASWSGKVVTHTHDTIVQSSLNHSLGERNKVAQNFQLRGSSLSRRHIIASFRGIETPPHSVAQNKFSHMIVCGVITIDSNRLLQMPKTTPPSLAQRLCLVPNLKPA